MRPLPGPPNTIIIGHWGKSFFLPESNFVTIIGSGKADSGRSAIRLCREDGLSNFGDFGGWGENLPVTTRIKAKKNLNYH